MLCGNALLQKLKGVCLIFLYVCLVDCRNSIEVLAQLSSKEDICSVKKQNSCVTESFGYALGRISLYVVLIALVFIERQKAVPGVGMVTCFTVFVLV